MSKQRFTLPAAVFLVLVKDEKVLLMRRANTGWCDGDYDLIAGHIDGNESLTTAVIREAKEEMGITVVPEAAKFSHLLHGLFSDDKEYFDIFFTAESWEGEPTIMEPDKCDKLAWFDLDNLPTNLTESTRLYFSAMAAHKLYSDFGFSHLQPIVSGAI